MEAPSFVHDDISACWKLHDMLCFASGAFMSALRDAVFVFDPVEKAAIMKQYNLSEDAAAAKGHKWWAARCVH